MPPHDNVVPTDTENEQTVWEDIQVDVEEPMDEDVPEEEPSEHEEESEPEEVSEGTEPEEVPSTPIASPSPPPPPQSYQAYMASLSRSGVAHQDPYLPSSSSTVPPRARWAWIRRMIGLWRREEGDSVPDVSHTPTMAPTCPITEEPTHLTIPLLVARLYRHENQLHDFIENRRNQFSPDFALQMHNGLRLLRNDHRELCDEMVTRENATTRRISELEGDVRRLQGLDGEVRELRRMMVEMTIQQRDGVGPSSRNGDR